jgi:ribosomal protein S18 acetylase RimI-like enzyme
MIAAETGMGEFVGYAWGGAYDHPLYRGELRQIMILPEYQRHGIGRRLVRHVAERLAEQGIHSMRVEVLYINPNRAFYERLGGAFLEEGVWDWDGVLLPKYVYGWADTGTLISAQ